MKIGHIRYIWILFQDAWKFKLFIFYKILGETPQCLIRHTYLNLERGILYTSMVPPFALWDGKWNTVVHVPAGLSWCWEQCGLSTIFLSTLAEGSVCRCFMTSLSDFSKGTSISENGSDWYDQCGQHDQCACVLWCSRRISQRVCISVRMRVINTISVVRMICALMFYDVPVR